MGDEGVESVDEGRRRVGMSDGTHQCDQAIIIITGPHTSRREKDQRHGPRRLRYRQAEQTAYERSYAELPSGAGRALRNRIYTPHPFCCAVLNAHKLTQVCGKKLGSHPHYIPRSLCFRLKFGKFKVII